jgi:hypothetical protein
MTKRTAVLIAAGALLLGRPAQAETVYEFVARCHAEKLGNCFNRISTRLDGLNSGAKRRICLPVRFAAISGVIRVSLLDHVRLKLSAARFGNAGSEADDVIVRIVNEIYPCAHTTAQRANGS